VSQAHGERAFQTEENSKCPQDRSVLVYLRNKNANSTEMSEPVRQHQDMKSGPDCLGSLRTYQSVDFSMNKKGASRKFGAEE
jgi:hypothetical protein